MDDLLAEIDAENYDKIAAIVEASPDAGAGLQSRYESDPNGCSLLVQYLYDHLFLIGDTL